ncbi:MAG: lamin tail domain-containing protein [Saprospiraceae bacterium]|nr:lamin tail domain-containing protein [Saprospiraceae bacterium]MCB9325583.1 lamin tail domain-containing protein [Lewinellaceae bacterium]
MKKVLLPVLFVLTFLGLHAQLVISEISYNPPESGTDSLEYIEIYNASGADTDPINLEGYYFTQGVEYTFPNYTINPGAYIVVAVNSQAMFNNFGVVAFQWTSGGLSNGGEDIAIANPAGITVDSVNYDDAGGWPLEPDGFGSSLVLCDYAGDHNDPANWQAASTDAGFDIAGVSVYGNPGAASGCQSDFLVRFISDGITVDESVGTVQLGVEYPAGDFVPWEVTVSLNAGSSTATLDWDYTFSDTTSLLSGFATDTMYLTIPIFDDAIPESTEQIVLELSATNIDVDILHQTFTIIIEDTDMLPGLPAYPIGTVTSVDADGVLDSLNVQCQIQGVVYGVNQRPAGMQFTIIDGNNDGIGVFKSSGNYGYTVNEGDEIIIQGTIGQFNGLAQIAPDTVWMVSAGNALFSPTVITTLDESAESQLVKIENLTLVDPGQWTNSGSGFNVDVTDGVNTYLMRIDNDVDLYGTTAPTGAFNLTGLGGQFDSSSPYTSGYQIFPRYMADIQLIAENDPNYPPYDIGLVTAFDADGVIDSVGVKCQLQGVVYGVNQRPAGMQFTIIDSNNDGVGVFKSSGNYGYTVNEGDEIIIRGTLEQYNGLAQIAPDTVWMVSAGNALFDPTVVTVLEESTESQLVKIENLTIVDPGQWTNSGSGFNVNVTDGVNTYLMRIDNDVDLYGTAAPTGAFNLTGLGGQFDSSSPYTSGYQILPRYIADIELIMDVDPNYPPYDIGLVTAINADGVIDSVGVKCQLQGVVYGVNQRPAGMQFTIIDGNNDGVGVFKSSGNYGYTVNEGDEIIIRGTLEQYNGLAQIAPDTVWMVSAGNALFDPTIVTVLEESTESQLVKIENLTIVDPGQWTNSGSGFNVDVTDGVNTYAMRIDNDVDLYGTLAPTTPFNLTGLGGQFDSSSPYTSGYQLLPRYTADIELLSTDGAVKFIGTGLIVNEDAGTIEVAVEYPAGDLVAWEVTVSLDVAGSSATEGMDFLWSDTTMYLSGFATDTVYLPVAIIDDLLPEDLENIVLNLTSTNATVDPNFDVYTIQIEDNDVFYPVYDIGVVTTMNADGVADSLGVKCQLQGVVYGVNQRPAGIQCTIIDSNNEGIGIFLNTGNFGYTVNEGDEVIVQGTIDQFSGLAQVALDSVWMVSSGNALFDPTLVTALDESTESQLVMITGLTIVDPGQWTNSGSGFNVNVTDGINTYAMRIDNDVEIFGGAVPDYAFDLVGIGGQFDSSSPYTSGYQILPRYWADISIIDAVNEPEPVKVELFPNPVTSRLFIRTGEAVDGIQLFNVLGQEVMSDLHKKEVFELDMSTLAKGVYHVRFSLNGKQWSKSVVKE